MITITREGGGFSVKLSDQGSGMRAWKVKAANTDEVKKAVDHYLDGAHATAPSQFCPICRSIDTKRKV